MAEAPTDLTPRVYRLVAAATATHAALATLLHSEAAQHLRGAIAPIMDSLDAATAPLTADPAYEAGRSVADRLGEYRDAQDRIIRAYEAELNYLPGMLEAARRRLAATDATIAAHQPPTPP